MSVHCARRHSGHFDIGQDEPANGTFDTLSLLGWDADAVRYFARTIENHGLARDYTLVPDGRAWSLNSSHERATIGFSEDVRRREIP